MGRVRINYRYYNPTDGRWTRRDPIVVRGKQNVCFYVANEPYSRIDALGLSLWNPLSWFNISQNQQPLNPLGPPSSERKKPCLDKDLAEPPKKIKSDCDNLVQAEMKAQKVSDILRKLRSIPGCKIPPIVCKCCNGDCAGVGGWHFSDKIVICTNLEKMFANINVIDILGHELTHRLQKCQNRYGGGCSNIIEHAKQSVLSGGQCSKAELTADVIQKATEYCKSIN